jgi:hypothetical protein
MATLLALWCGSGRHLESAEHDREMEFNGKRVCQLLKTANAPIFEG